MLSAIGDRRRALSELRAVLLNDQEWRRGEGID